MHRSTVTLLLLRGWHTYRKGLLDQWMSDNRSAQDGGAQDSVEMKQLPIKAYLDQQLMPLLVEALAQLAKEKPEEPIEFVAKYLLDLGSLKYIWVSNTSF